MVQGSRTVFTLKKIFELGTSSPARSKAANNQNFSEIRLLGSEIIATRMMDWRTTDKFWLHELCWHRQAELNIIKIVTLQPMGKCQIANILEMANRRAKQRKLGLGSISVTYVKWGSLTHFRLHEHGTLRNATSLSFRPILTKLYDKYVSHGRHIGYYCLAFCQKLKKLWKFDVLFFLTQDHIGLVH